MAYYPDLRSYIQTLEKADKLFRITEKVNKDTQLHPMVRWQFRGLAEKERKAFLFENVFDAKGRVYDTPVLVAAHAASREVYALAMMCRVDEIMQTWQRAQLHPIAPKIVASGPVQEEIHVGDGLLEHGGLEEFPVPISTPGFDNAPYFTAANWVTRNPDTDTYNIGNYRGMVKAQDRVGCCSLPPQHNFLNWQKYRERGIPMPAAVVIGPTPNIGLVATNKLAYGLSEYDVAGGIAGEPVQVVKCRTVDLVVPATAEIVIEGQMPVDCLEREAPFGEMTGYMGGRLMNRFLNITCITHRKKPIWNAFLSQFPPSESSILRGVGLEGAYYKLLKNDLSLANLVDVAFHDASGAYQFCVIKLDKPTQAQVWQALHGAVALAPTHGKMIVVVDEDIDARDLDSVVWALAYRMQPHKDIQIVQGKTAALDPSAAPLTENEARTEYAPSSAVLINATRKWGFPPVALPKKEFMEEAKTLWEKCGLPPLKPKVPWHGYLLGSWSKEDEEEAELALKGEHFKTGEKLARGRIKL
ncbi:MAG: UbiD family decarboxylase [Desulfobacterales bacterium]|nr:UbiD family decarboxylase [Desulfobacterales bacterium]